jgi:cytochrome c biogenesis factor
MTLGGAWSYMEQGWGGYWAWDPVENTSLLVWMAALVAVHAAPRVRPVMALACCLAPWVLAILGGALVRSGRTPSVHGFAEQLGVGWTLFGLAVATAGAFTYVVVKQRAGAERRDASGDPRRVMVLLMSIGIGVVLVGTITPVLHDLFGGRATAVGGEFFSRTVGPLAVGAVPFLALQLRRPTGWSRLAHVGVLVLLVGVGLSPFDDVSSTGVTQGETLRVAGVDVRNDGVTVGDGPREGTDSVTADLTVGGRAMRPSIVVYPDRGGRLAEVAVHTGVFTDVHATLLSATDNGTVIVNIHRRHGMWLVWLGALFVTIATLASARARVGHHAADRRVAIIAGS